MPVSGTLRARAVVGVLLATITAAMLGWTASASAEEVGSVDPMASWQGALAQAETAPGNVLFIGDSITEGYYAQDRAHWWVDQVRTRLQSDFGGGGLGYVPVVAGYSDAPPLLDLWTYAGGAPSTTGLGERSYAITSASGYAQVTLPA